MLVIKYTKEGSAKFISHLDFLRHFSRILRRQGVVLEMSKGFNPHELMYFAPPSSTGLSSIAEYCTIATKQSAENFKENFNEVSLENVCAIYVKEVEKNPNLASIATFAQYEFPCDGVVENRIEEAFGQETFQISFEKKGETVTKEVRNLMKSFEIENNVVKVVLAVGENTLRIDRFLSAIGCDIISKVQKTKLFYNSEDTLKNVDELFV